MGRFDSKELLENQEAPNAMAEVCNLYGDGYACERIADILLVKEYLGVDGRVNVLL